MHQDIAKRLIDISSKIQKACHQAKRSEDEIRLVAVSKLQSVDIIKEAYALGINNFGENYAQELAEKSSSCPNDIIWHFIGPLQSNKTKIISNYAHWVNSLDREKISNKINTECGNLNKKINGCIQVNISEEQSKSGLRPKELLDYADHIKSLENIDLKGIMVLPSLSGDVNKQMIKSKKLHEKLIKSHPNAKYLSMGTTNDFESAIKFGSNMIRIGELIFGKR